MKQVLAHLRQDPLVSIISMLGTAIAIFLIMVTVIKKEVKVMPFAPESHRNRFLVANGVSASDRGHHWMECGSFSLHLVKELYGNLKTPEAVTIFERWMDTPSLVETSENNTSLADRKGTDVSFWHVFDFDFISGTPYSQADFNAQRHVAVISETMALRLFGRTHVAGSNFYLNHSRYKVRGVVRDVSTITQDAYSQVWIPYSIDAEAYSHKIEQNKDISGKYKVVILARKTSDFDKIRNEVKTNYDKVNKSLENKDIVIDRMNKPDTQFKDAISQYTSSEPDEGAFLLKQALIILILLLVPAINLSSMTQSRLRRRLTEIGIRRAFGCTRSKMIRDILNENFILSLAGGAIGLLLTFLFVYFGTEHIVDDYWNTYLGHAFVNFQILFNPIVFAFALLFCYLLNVISNVIPAWRASRSNIVNAINGNNR